MYVDLLRILTWSQKAPAQGRTGTICWISKGFLFLRESICQKIGNRKRLLESASFFCEKLVQIFSADFVGSYFSHRKKPHYIPKL